MLKLEKNKLLNNITKLNKINILTIIWLVKFVNKQNSVTVTLKKITLLLLNYIFYYHIVT